MMMVVTLYPFVAALASLLDEAVEFVGTMDGRDEGLKNGSLVGFDDGWLVGFDEGLKNGSTVG